MGHFPCALDVLFERFHGFIELVEFNLTLISALPPCRHYLNATFKDYIVPRTKIIIIFKYQTLFLKKFILATDISWDLCRRRS